MRTFGMSRGEPSVEILVQRVRAGDSVAFEAVVGRYSQRVRRVAMRILKDPLDVEEVLQDVFIAVFEKLDRFRGESTVWTWIYRVAVNEALMHMRRRKSRVPVEMVEFREELDVHDSMAMSANIHRERPDDYALRKETRAAIHTAIEKLG